MSESDRVAVDTDDIWPEDASDVDECVVSNWFVSEGAHVEEGETIGEIQVEKVSVDVVAPVSGDVDELVHGEGDECRRGETVAYVRPA